MSAILTVIVNTGIWFHDQRHAQSVADAAALAGAHALATDRDPVAAARAAASDNGWSADPEPCDATANPPQPLCYRFSNGSSTIDVQTAQEVAAVPILNAYTMTISTHAQATLGAAATVSHVAPIGIECNPTCAGSEPFRFDNGTPGSNTLVPLKLPGIQTDADFGRLLGCDPQNPDQQICENAKLTTGDAFPQFLFGVDGPDGCDNGNGNGGNNNGNNANGNNGNGNGGNGNGNGNGNPFDRAQARELHNDLVQEGGSLHLVPVFAGAPDVNGYSVVGWAAAIFSVGSFSPCDTTVTGMVTFERIFVDGSSLPSANDPRPLDFGVRAIALTG